MRECVRIVTEYYLSAIERSGNLPKAVLTHEFGRARQEIAIGRMNAELGTEPVDQLFHDLKPLSKSHGVTDVNALKSGISQPWFSDNGGGLLMFRVGDAVASCDIQWCDAGLLADHEGRLTPMTRGWSAWSWPQWLNV